MNIPNGNFLRFLDRKYRSNVIDETIEMPPGCRNHPKPSCRSAVSG
jgi:hypothetical protein